MIIQGFDSHIVSVEKPISNRLNEYLHRMHYFIPSQNKHISFHAFILKSKQKIHWNNNKQKYKISIPQACILKYF